VVFGKRTLVRESLVHHARLNFALALGVAAGTAVLTGALLVGDSVRESLRRLTLERLGPVEAVLVTDRFFDESFVADVTSDESWPDSTRAFPVIVLGATVERPTDPNRPDEPISRVGQVNVYGIPDDFFAQSPETSGLTMPSGSAVVNDALHGDLQAELGGEIIVRLPEISQVPRDSALAAKTNTVRSLRVTLAGVAPDRSMADLRLNPQQQTARNLFLPLRDLQRAIGLYDRQAGQGSVNAVFVTNKENAVLSPEVVAALNAKLAPSLTDYGLDLEKTEHGFFLLTSRRLLVDPSAVEAASKAFPDDRVQPVMTYLANTIALGDKEIPYSTITGVDPRVEPPLGPMTTAAGEPLAELPDDGIALTSWAAEDLGAAVGDEIRIEFFDPESTHGQVTSHEETFRLVAILPLAGLIEDKRWTPEFPGITDSLTIADWEPPFPFDEGRVRDKDERYWEAYGATPKAFVSLQTAQRLFGSRFGDVSSLRIAAEEDATVESVADKLEGQIQPADLGFAFRAIKAEQLAASSGATPFDLLFFGFSMFIIAAAVLLVALLFRLSVEGRAREIGVQLASGLSIKRVRGLLVSEALIVSLIGGAVGVAIGIGYAWLMIWALRSPLFWQSAVGTPYLELFVGFNNIHTLVIGYLSGVLVCLGVIWFSTRRLRQASVPRLLSGQTSSEDRRVTGPSRIGQAIALLCLIGAVSLVPLGMKLDAMAQAGAFFGSGALVLTALLILIRSSLRGAGRRTVGFQSAALVRLAYRNAARNAARSVLTIGLVASATFLIVAISAFHLDSGLMAIEKTSGNGGFRLIGQTDQPVFRPMNVSDFSSPDLAAFEWNLQDEELAALQNVQVASLRFRPGDDSSCLNLYQTDSPLVLGVPQSFIERGGWAFSGSLASQYGVEDNPWALLSQPRASEEQSLGVPVIIDGATAQYGLKVGLGSTFEIRDGDGQLFPVHVVGLLSNSVLQGGVIMSEENFLNRYPMQSGYQYFLFDVPADEADAVTAIYERVFAEEGLAMESTRQRLAEYLAVQNTYLLTFQSLGGLGLLLGTFGLGIVQIRNVLERRGELALMRATGFRQARLAWLVLAENLLLLLGGLAVGVIAAAVAISPHLVGGSAAIPWTTLSVVLGLVLVVGMLSGLSAVSYTLNAPLLQSLRRE
jgi:ABC-type antimicrobial peptide transport system permease subunit